MPNLLSYLKKIPTVDEVTAFPALPTTKDEAVEMARNIARKALYTVIPEPGTIEFAKRLLQGDEEVKPQTTAEKLFLPAYMYKQRKYVKPMAKDVGDYTMLYNLAKGLGKNVAAKRQAKMQAQKLADANELESLISEAKGFRDGGEFDAYLTRKGRNIESIVKKYYPNKSYISALDEIVKGRTPKVPIDYGAGIDVYHGTDKTFSKISGDFSDTSSKTGVGKGHIFYTTDKDVAGSYGKKILTERLQPKNPLIVDAGGLDWTDIKYRGKSYNINELAKLAEKKGYGSLIVENLRDTGGKQATGIPSGFKTSTTIATFSENISKQPPLTDMHKAKLADAKGALMKDAGTSPNAKALYSKPAKDLSSMHKIKLAPGIYDYVPKEITPENVMKPSIKEVGGKIVDVPGRKAYNALLEKFSREKPINTKLIQKVLDAMPAGAEKDAMMNIFGK